VESFIKHEWTLFVIVMIVNALIMRIRSRRYIAADPSLQEGYRKLFWGTLIWGNIPWIIMGIGLETRFVPSMDNFLHPLEGNPFVVGFFASCYLIFALGTYWIFVRGGAEMIICHPGQFFWNYDFQSTGEVKAVWCFFLAAGIGSSFFFI
jgi:hypothetical protein